MKNSVAEGKHRDDGVHLGPPKDIIVRALGSVVCRYSIQGQLVICNYVRLIIGWRWFSRVPSNTLFPINFTVNRVPSGAVWR